MSHRIRRRVGFAPALLVVSAAGCFSSPEPKGPRRVAGQQVPQEAVSIDFAKRFNLHTTLGKEAADFKNCKIVGFVEGEEAAPSGGWTISSGYIPFAQNGWSSNCPTGGARTCRPIR